MLFENDGFILNSPMLLAWQNVECTLRKRELYRWRFLRASSLKLIFSIPPPRKKRLHSTPFQRHKRLKHIGIFSGLHFIPLHFVCSALLPLAFLVFQTNTRFTKLFAYLRQALAKPSFPCFKSSVSLKRCDFQKKRSRNFMKLKGDISLNVRRYGLEGTHIANERSLSLTLD